ncbi:16S rRNA (guanine(527)-N(7))-methyltransferase RsmG [Eubacteriales bacterium mix99]
MKDDRSLLADGCAKMGLNLKDTQVRCFETYLSLLLEWNQKMNLTAIDTPQEVIAEHFLDSISVLKVCTPKKGAQVLDVGSGAGFPGIPMRIMRPDIHLTMVDAVLKKTLFLAEARKQLGLDECRILHARAEDLGKTRLHREKYDVVVSRAVAPMRVLAEYCLPFVRVGGCFVAHKGPAAPEEIRSAEQAIKILGGQVKKTEKTEIVGSGRTHILVVIGKTAKTPSKYPRSAGKPKKSPL